MNKKQKLRNAVILGLLMSSVTASSAWAKDFNGVVHSDGGIQNEHQYENAYIKNNGDYWLSDVGSYGLWAENWKNYNGSISFSVENKLDMYVTNKDDKGVYVVGLLAGESNIGSKEGETEPVLKVNAGNDIDINVLSINDKAAYGILSNHGKIDLISENGNILLNVSSANGDAVGIYTNSDKLTTLNSKYNRITAVADGTGTAIGIKAENGSKVNITGDTYVSGDNGAIVINGKGVNTIADGEQEKQLTVDGNLFVSAEEGTVITIENGASEHVKGNLISASGDKDNAYSNISLTDRSSLTVDGYAVIQGGKTGLELNNSTATFGKYGVSNYIIANEKALSMNNNSALTVNGSSIFVAGAGNSTAIEVAEGSQFTSNGSVTALGGAHGIVLGGNGQFTINDAGINFIKASAARKDVTTEYDHYNAVSVGAGSQFDVSGEINVLQAGNITKDFGSETAVSVVGSDTQNGKFVLTGERGNLIQGAVYAQNGDVEISSGGSNVIYSAAHGYATSSDGSEHLVSALYAAENAGINLTAVNGVNVIRSSAEFVHKDEETGEFIDREITVWAENGGNVNITGAVYIASSNAGEYTYDNEENPVKGNALGIAVSAGGRDIENGSLNPDVEIGEVNINYGSAVSDSMIIGDIVAGYGGKINITSNTSNDIIPLVDEGFTRGDSLVVKGNILAANGGSAYVDFGSGGYWEGRADDYGDANLADHESFYNPAFSNDIVAGGEVNVKMQNGIWNVTAQSWLTSFEGDNNTIDMVSYENNGTHAVSIKELNGKDNTFKMGLNHKDHGNSDMLYIKGGDANIDIVVNGTIEGLENISEENGLRFATVGNGITFGKEENGRRYISGLNTGMFNTRLYVKDSAYDSTNDKENAGYNGDDLTANKPGNGSVEDFFKPDEDTPEVLDLTATNENINADNWEIVDFAQDGMSSTGKTVLDLSKVNYSNAVYMDRFNKRIGEARFIDGDEGMWVRLRHDRIGNEDSYRSMNTMYEIGYDAKQVKEDGEHRVGFAIDYMDGSSSFSQVAGTGEVSRKGFWMYDSWMGEKGHYRDFVAKWGHLSNDFEFMAGSDEAKADFSNNVYSISAEFGKKNDIGNNWYFEPQAQLQYAHVTGAEYTTSLAGADQTEIRNDAFNSLIARAGFRLGRDISNTSTVYFKGDVLHEFLGDQDVFAKDSTTSNNWQSVGYDHSGTWYDLGFGFAVKMNKASYAYLDFEKSFGNDHDETYQINAGLQWAF